MMATSGKKGKKNKGTVISLQSFLANGDSPAGTTQVSKKIRNIDGDESDDGTGGFPLVYQLPTAPKANRVFDDESVPHKPPFMCFITNLPFDANEDDVRNFFESSAVTLLRLPKDETGRVRGFGYVEFENRNDLIHALSLPDPSIKGRRIRIELEQTPNRNKNNRRGFEGFSNHGEGRDSGSSNWRREQNNDFSGFSDNKDRSYRDRNFGSEENSTPGSWRLGNRPSDTLPRTERSDDRDGRDFGGKSRYAREALDQRAERESTVERPKLVLKPRTLPLPEIKAIANVEIEESDKSENVASNKISAASSQNVFGSAKPVDTASREQEIEERLEQARRSEKLSREKEHEELNAALTVVHLEKTEKESTNSAISWRSRNDPGTKKSECSPERQDSYRRGSRDRNPTRNNKNYEKSNRSDQNQEGKRDDSKIKIERSMPKQATNLPDTIQSTNKYFGLDDEASE